MTDLASFTSAQKAARLIYKGLNAKATTLRGGGDKEYEQLIALYRASNEFQTLVQELSEALCLKVVDIDENDEAIILSPLDPDSLFAPRISDIRTQLQETPRGELALILIAIAATFYPSAASLTEDEYERKLIPSTLDSGGLTPLTATPRRVAQLLLENCKHLAEKAPSDMDLSKTSLEEAWRRLANLPEVRPGTQGVSMKSVEGMVSKMFKVLEDNGMVRPVVGIDGTPDTEQAYAPTDRYRLQVREQASNEVFRFCVEELSGFDGGGR